MITMKTILGLDLGPASIGWALIEADDKDTPARIIGMGSRIIPLSSDDRDQFQKGQAITKNQDRTRARSQRKGYDRKQLKKHSLKEVLKKYNIFPSEALMQLPMLDLWKLRSDAADPGNDISGEQLGRILYMLNQKRGYKSARSEANADKKDTDYVQAVKGRYAQLKDRDQTIGQYFYEQLASAYNSNTYFRIKEEVYPREAYIEEFDKIINAQKGKHDFLTEDVVNRLRNEIIYFQRKLKSQKGLVGICEVAGLEKTVFDKEKNCEKTVFIGPRVAPRTSPLFQLCSIWETVNNISLKVKNPEGSKYKWADRILTLEEKQQIADYLFRNDKLSFTELLRILNLKKEDAYVNKQILKGIKGNEVYAAIHNITGEHPLLTFQPAVVPSGKAAVLADKRTGEVLEQQQGLMISKAVEQEPFYQLWHTIYSIKELDECKNALIKRFGFEDATADKLSRLDFNKQAFGNKSNKAMRHILPYLMQGYNYAHARSLAGYNHSDSPTKAEKEQRATATKLELLPKNSLRQPVVEKILNQMIHVVNAIIGQYGKPAEIRVELARELKQSKDERNETDIMMTKNKKLHEEIARRLTELGLPATRRYIQRYKFIFPSLSRTLKDAHPCNQCIYCGEIFNLSEALNGDAYDEDHIIPRSLLFDDSQTNRVLVHRKCNADKGNQTAYDYIAGKGARELEIFLDRVDDWHKKGIISYSKMQRLKVSYNEYAERKKQHRETESDRKLWEHFIDRQLRETQYIARKSREILQKVCSNVTATEGNITAKLRELWGWDDVLMHLQMPKYRALEAETGKTLITVKEWTSDHGRRKHRKEEIINWSKRDDHRHHAIDALVIACTRQGFIQRINTLNASDTKDEMRRAIDDAKKAGGKDLVEAASIDPAVQQHKEKARLLDEYLVSQRPPAFTTKYLEQAADSILVSFKPGKKVATITKFKATGKNKEKGVIVPRGALHEQSVYGKIKVIEQDKPLKYLFGHTDKIIDSRVKALVTARIAEHGNNIRLALSSLKKSPIYLDEQKTEILEKASCYNDATVLKYKLQSLKASQVDDIVDEKVKALVKARLQEYGNKEKEAFKDVLWFNGEKQIPIRTVRLFAKPDANNLQPIAKDATGKDIGFVLTGNNHHIAIYEDQDGKLMQHRCTFWHAVERKKYKLPVVITDTPELWNNLLGENYPETFLSKLPADNLKLKFSMQQNEMFVLGLSQEEFEEALSTNNKPLLSKHLYLVWRLSDNDYYFRHHLETKNSELERIKEAKDAKRFYRFKSVGALVKENPIKVQLNHLGEIINVWR